MPFLALPVHCQVNIPHAWSLNCSFSVLQSALTLQSSARPAAAMPGFWACPVLCSHVPILMQFTDPVYVLEDCFHDLPRRFEWCHSRAICMLTK